MKAASPEAVATMKAMRAKGHSISEICAAVGHGRNCVHTHTKDIPMPYGPLRSGPKRKLPTAIARKMRAEGATYRQIAARFGCSATTVHAALSGRRLA